MKTGKITALFLGSAIIFAIAPVKNASAERISYAEYMKRKKYPNLYQPSQPASSQQYYNYGAQEQYASRPPAPYFDNNVPQAQQQQLRPVPQAPVYTPPVYQPPVYNAPPPPAYVPMAEAAEPEQEKILGGTTSGSVGATSDYVFRGITQTREGPALQGGLEYEHAIGLYAGVWGSNVDFADADEAQLEVDIYGGYRASVTDELSVDVGALYYAYPGANKSLNYDYSEFFVSSEYALPLAMGAGSMLETESVNIGAAFYYSPEYFGEADSSYYLKGTAAVPFKNGFTLDGHMGKQWFKDNTLAALPDYVDWSVGVAYALPQDFEVKVQYTDTNIEEADCPDGCDGKGVVTLTKSF